MLIFHWPEVVQPNCPLPALLALHALPSDQLTRPALRRPLRRPEGCLLQWGAGPLACAQRAAGLQLSCCAPGSSPAQLTAVQVGRASARPTTNPAQGAPRPRPARAPRMRRGARARAPALPVPARPGPSFCPISQPRVCPESRRSRRELSNKVLYVIVTWFSALKWRCRGQNFLPGLRPGPRGRTGPLAGYGVCWGVPPRTSIGAGGESRQS